MHNNYFTVKSDSYFDLGVQTGQLFKSQAHAALDSQEDWGTKVDFANTLLDISSRYFPNYIEELKGYAQGAEIDFIDMWTLGLEDDAEIGTKLNEKCSTLITNNGLLTGHNEDSYDSGLEETVCILRKEINDFKTLEIFYYNTIGGTSIGVNSSGIVHSINTLIGSKVKRTGIPKTLIARKLMDTINPKEDYSFLKSLPRLSGFNHNFSTINKEIYTVEFTVDSNMDLIRVMGSFCHTNHQLNEDIEYEKEKSGTLSRLEFANEKISDLQTVEDMKLLLSNNSFGDEKSLYNKRTIANMIVDLEGGVALIKLGREPELGWVEYELDFI
jgi:hypothetical protein